MPTPSEQTSPPPGTNAQAMPRSDEVDIALCRATLYAAVALGFRPPTTETLERLADTAANEALTDAARFLEADSGNTSLATAVAALALPQIDLQDLEAHYRSLFGHTARGAVPPYETEYGNEALFQQPQELSDLAGFMRAFGLVVHPGAHERIDHVSCESEFLAFLACKQAFAVEHGDVAMHAATVRATTLFLRDHFGRFVPTFARRLGGADPGGFYSALGALLGRLVDADVRRWRVSVGAANLGLRPDPATCAAPMGCAANGEGDGCPVGGREP